MLHHGSTGLDAPVLHQQSQRFSQLNLLSTIGCLEIDLGSASQVQGHCIQWKARIQLANLIACFAFCDEMGLYVKGCIARPGQFPRQMLRPLNAKIPSNDAENYPIPLLARRGAMGFSRCRSVGGTLADPRRVDGMGTWRCCRAHRRCRPRLKPWPAVQDPCFEVPFALHRQWQTAPNGAQNRQHFHQSQPIKWPEPCDVR